jgi:hypothetical protein
VTCFSISRQDFEGKSSPFVHSRHLPILCSSSTATLQAKLAVSRRYRYDQYCTRSVLGVIHNSIKRIRTKNYITCTHLPPSSCWRTLAKLGGLESILSDPPGRPSLDCGCSPCSIPPSETDFTYEPVLNPIHLTHSWKSSLQDFLPPIEVAPTTNMKFM